MSSVRDQLNSICTRHIEGISFNSEDNLFELGISSLTLAEIHASIEDNWPDTVDITDLFDYPTIDQLASLIDSRLAADANSG